MAYSVLTLDMLRAQLHCARQSSIETVYGVVTTNSAWKLLCLRGVRVVVEVTEYDLSEVERMVGILVAMLKDAEGEQGLSVDASQAGW